MALSIENMALLASLGTDRDKPEAGDIPGNVSAGDCSPSG